MIMMENVLIIVLESLEAFEEKIMITQQLNQIPQFNKIPPRWFVRHGGQLYTQRYATRLAQYLIGTVEDENLYGLWKNPAQMEPYNWVVVFIPTKLSMFASDVYDAAIKTHKRNCTYFTWDRETSTITTHSAFEFALITLQNCDYNKGVNPEYFHEEIYTIRVNNNHMDIIELKPKMTESFDLVRYSERIKNQ